MTLRSRLAGQILMLLVAMAALGGSAVWGLTRLRQDFGTALRGYQSLRQLYEVGWHIAAAKLLLSLPQPDERRALLELYMAAGMFGSTENSGDGSATPDPLLATVRQAIDQVRGKSPEVSQTLDTIMARLRDRAGGVRSMIEQAERDADRRKWDTVFTLSTVGLVMLLGALAIGTAHYRSIMLPLQRLTRSVKQIASGSLEARVSPTGDREFVELATDFNKMADQLDALYRDLEQQVKSRTQMLVRSERLAGVGALAAGVAHEINNPLAIIAGHAQVQVDRMRRDGIDDAPLAESLRVICDEAFRAKKIIDRLLSLSRRSEEGRRPVDPSVVAYDLVRAVSALPAAARRSIEFIDETKEDVEVIADEAELKQVLLNLLVNALQATAPDTGRVVIRVGQHGNRVRLTVEDNGAGMSPAVQQRLFEPFFSARPSDPETGQRGVGLGLSITHAIVHAHGGTIEGFSEGEGKGSRFVVELPLAGTPGKG
jgi:signal transduction histidine kinase